MKIFIYVEGPADVLALGRLFGPWREKMRPAGHGIEIIHLDNKAKYFKKIGPRAAEKLAANKKDFVVGLPDLYPNREYNNTEFRHRNLAELIQVQQHLVTEALVTTQMIKRKSVSPYLRRFLPCALKHDLEMLVLAAEKQLKEQLKTRDKLADRWRRPVENQNQLHPPKYVVEKLFHDKAGRRYADTRDAPAILGRIGDLSEIIFCQDRKVNCPVFKSAVDWIGERTGISAY